MAKKKIEQLVTVNLPTKYQKSYGIYMKLRWTGGWEVVQVLPGGAVFFSDQIQATDVIKSVDNVKVTFWNYKKIDGLFRDAIKQERTLVLEVVKGPGDNKRQKKEEKERKEERRAIAVLRRIFTNKEERVKLTKSDELQELYEEEEHFIE